MSISTPNWDSRNSSFLSPLRLQELRATQPTHNFTSSPLKQSMSADEPQPRPRPQQPSSTHTRTSSFFSSFRKQSSSTSGDSSLHRSPSNLPNTSPDIPRKSLQYDQRSTSPPLPQQQDQQPQPQSQSQPQQPPAPQQPPPLHPEIRSIVQLTVSHAHKIYFSGPLVRRVEREANGNKPVKDEGWTEVWVQLGGTTLSIWDMKQIQEASQQGKEVPPTYVNMMDAFVQVLGSVTVPATPTTPAQRYTNVLTLNTAGSNLLLFACQSTQALISWAAALRLSAWEKSRLEEIYTAHLIRITLSARDIPTTLIRGRLEGWVRIRVAGQTDWKLVWMVISTGSDGAPDELGRVTSNGGAPHQTGGRPNTMKRMSNLFGRDHSPQRNAGPSKPMITMYAGQKPRDRKKPILTMSDVTQAFAVYPERPELIQRSTLIKVEGTMGEEEIAGSMRTREGWLLVMPQLEGNLSPAAEMLKWVIAFHDAFRLYGRPQAWTWDPRDPASLMFAYPVGPHKDLLFLEREQAETLDPRDDRTSAIRSNLLSVLTNKMREQHGQPGPQQEPIRAPAEAPSLPPIRSSSGNAGPQLPPLSFGGDSRPIGHQDRELLTPITERSSVYTHGRPNSIEANSILAKPGTSPVPEEPSPVSVQDEKKNILDQPFSTSPSSAGKSLHPETNGYAEVVPPTPEKDARFGSLSGRRSNESGSISRTGPSPSLSLSGGSVDRSDSFSYAVHTALPPSAPMSPQETPNRPPSPRSILTSPFSIAEPDRASITQSLTESHNLYPSNQSTNSSSFGLGPTGSPGAPRDRASVLTSPYSPLSSPKQSPSAFPPNSSRGSNEDHGLSNEAGALFYMQQFGEKSGPGSSPTPNRRMPSTIAEGDDDSESDEDKPQPMSRDRDRVTTPVGSSSLYSKDSSSINNKSPVVRQGTPMAFANIPTSGGSSPVPEDRVNPNSRNLGRKPSGARAQMQASNSRFTGTEVASNSLSSQKLSEEEAQTDDEEDEMDAPASATSPAAMAQPAQPPVDDDSLDAYAALSYLDINDQQPPPPAVTTTQQQSPQQTQSIPKVNLPGPSTPGSGEPAVYRSSFAPSKQAAERKAKVQAQQAAQAAAASRPGRANGKKKRPVSTQAGAWQESSDEEEEEDDDDDDDDEEVDSDVEPQSKPASGGNSSNNSIKPPGENFNGENGDQAYSHLRPPRTLPLPPGGRGTADGDEQQYSRRPSASQYPEQSRRTYLDDGTPIRTQAEHPMPGAARQTMWSQVLDPGHTPGAVPEQNNGRDTFVQIEPPSQTMTKAFTPQGLLSAGMQDRQDRSAKRQEELARETGASLINVPNKPPPPQTGLLGAVSAHERERKREGGLGAALTEREREKRVAEERQRKFDEQQRQQMEQMQQGGSMYGFPGYNPMMMGMNPMMMGMNPMMTGGGMGGMNPMMTGNGMQGMGGMSPMMTGYSGMMPGYNPQHMFAAQQAAQAYQQAMMAFSVAGSQAGGEGGNGGNSPNGGSPMNPMMTGSMYDPRMSMMGMPMMGMGGGMGMQMTGMSQFDPRAGPQGGSPSGLNDPNGLLPPNSGFASNTSSPARRGSPLARPPTNGEATRSSSRPASPKA
ncbi:hypothetical protein K435DRAFT_959906 [Dendrothele bispora CBS 962.96]|uniref:PH domain-containing protein n=1 Tax=Dendrothele bispora (strain CBS 962.96) TaxID=1314807 RepID=A0A4S8MVJ7_DENBC|nr:hypothetical protein K435DRAFT_959906 [Dendrothele bispora CBS 962.96]